MVTLILDFILTKHVLTDFFVVVANSWSSYFLEQMFDFGFGSNIYVANVKVKITNRALFLYVMIFLKHFIYLYVCACVSWCVYGSQRTICRRKFFPSTMWGLKIELRSSKLTAGTLIHGSHVTS